MDCRSSVGMPKTNHLAVDWHHNESPLGGRSAVDCLLKSAQALSKTMYSSLGTDTFTTVTELESTAATVPEKISLAGAVILTAAFKVAGKLTWGCPRVSN